MSSLRCWPSLLVFVAMSVIAQEDHSQHRAEDPHPEHHQHQSAEQSGDRQHQHASHVNPTASEQAHVPPDPPKLVLGEMSTERMIELMQMEDDASIAMFRIDELEGFRTDGETGIAWDAEIWYGDDYDKVWFKTEGERFDRATEARAELLWDRIVSAWWSVRAGARHDSFAATSRTWAAVGLQGLAPHHFEVETMLYVGEAGRMAVRFEVARELLLTQRLVLEPQLELNAYSKDDRANGIGAGISDLELGLRLRYELMREVAPYVGLTWTRKFGDTAKLARGPERSTEEAAFVAGVRVWF